MRRRTEQGIRYMIAVALWLSIMNLWAVPAQRRPFTVTNSDGSQLTLVLCGDESFHFYTTEDGTPVVQDGQGDWHLAPELADSISETWSYRSRRRNEQRIQRATTMRAKRTWGKPSHYEGQKKGIVLLTQFPNKAMASTSTIAHFKAMFNEEGYSGNLQKGSVRDYFLSQSYGKLDLTFDVFGPVEADYNYSHYGGNDSEGNDTCVAKLAAEVCVKADKLYDINWKNYDWDGDGTVDQVLIVYAGNGEHAGNPANTIWPHEWSLSAGAYYHDGNGPITLGNCVIDTYAMVCELYGASKSQMEGIGTPCHEFSHCLGLPDFYDTSYKGGFGMDAWDVMAAGSYNGQRNGCPAGYTAYERWYAGWLDLIELQEPTTITNMPNLQDEPVAYIIRNDGNSNESYILENRQSKGWFEYVESYTGFHGMLVSHITYSAGAWQDNEVNSKLERQRMTIIPANDNYGQLSSNKVYYVSKEVRSGQLFPGTGNVTELTNTSHTKGAKLLTPNTDKSYNMNKPITNIQETNGLISFDFMGGAPSVDITSLHTPPSLPPTAYYTLNGTLATKPLKPGIYIVKEEGHIRKVVIH